MMSGRTDVRPLGRRLALAMIATMLLLAVGVTAVQWWNVYSAALQRQRAQFDEIQRTFVPSLASAVWKADRDSVALLVDGIARLDSVGAVQLKTVDGDVILKGNAGPGQAGTRTYRLAVEQGRRFELGELSVSPSRAAILRELRERAIARATALLLVLGAGTAVLLRMLESRVARPVRRLAGYARAIGPGTLDQPLGWRRRPGSPRDELDDLADALERMRQAMHAEIAVRERHEAELTEHRDRLEELVQQRTRELEATVAELAAQRDAVQRLADTDALTGAASRRHFELSAERDIARARRERRPLSLLMLDIDHFKSINDRYGHTGGDRVLQACVAACQARLRETDLVGRLGGEEFAVLLTDTALPDACRVADELRESLSRLRIPLGEDVPVGFTVSVGVAELDTGGLDALVSVADEALYAAKRGGRNRVVAGPGGHPD